MSFGFSSFKQPIENPTKAIQDGLQQLNMFLQGAQTAGSLNLDVPPIRTVSTRVDLFPEAFSTQCMKGAEVSQRWLAIGVIDWIKAGRWWLLKARSGLQTLGKDIVPTEAYLNLLKASWILREVIVVHPQFSVMESSVQYEVMELIQVRHFSVCIQ